VGKIAFKGDLQG